MVTGMVDTQEEARLTINLAAPTTPQKSIRGGTSVWDTSLFINKISPNDQKVLWTELKITMKSSTGSILLIQTTPVDDVGAYDDSAPIAVQVWYVETGGNTRLDPGDAVKVTGMTSEFEGATVEWTKGGELIASSTLPTDFP